MRRARHRSCAVKQDVGRPGRPAAALGPSDVVDQLGNDTLAVERAEVRHRPRSSVPRKARSWVASCSFAEPADLRHVQRLDRSGAEPLPRSPRPPRRPGTAAGRYRSARLICPPSAAAREPRVPPGRKTGQPDGIGARRLARPSSDPPGGLGRGRTPGRFLHRDRRSARLAMGLRRRRGMRPRGQPRSAISGRVGSPGSPRPEGSRPPRPEQEPPSPAV